jgi:hypothetical protein
MDNRNEFRDAILDVIENFKDRVVPPEVVYELVCLATLLALTYCLDKVTGIQHVLDCVSMAIDSYKQNGEV